uniref:Transmembrane protein n=1 Tax=Caloglossa beccarii TaxID=131038 RepID=A0A1Z1M8H4_9FLOR|nr:hypothetical protein [Caloglossa beccarii]ARW62378.1 hypothetical protein [Caloglossa beccarii]
MNKKLFVIIKLNLLQLSFQVLSSHLLKEYKYSCKLSTRKFNYKLINRLTIHNYYLDYKYNFNKIKFILSIYKLSQNKIIQNLTQNIFKNNYNRLYADNITAHIKYFNKFRYSYYKNYNYYEYSKLKVNIYYFAIINLYIIAQCYKNKNIFFLIKYLYDPIF